MCAKTVWYLFMSRLSTIVSSLSDYSGCPPFALASSITINQPLPFPISSQGPFPTDWMIIKYSVSREHETVFGSWPPSHRNVPKFFTTTFKLFFFGYWNFIDLLIWLFISHHSIIRVNWISFFATLQPASHYAEMSQAWPIETLHKRKPTTAVHK